MSIGGWSKSGLSEILAVQSAKPLTYEGRRVEVGLLTLFNKRGKQRKEKRMSKELAKTYDPKAIEEKLYEKWCEKQIFSR